VTHGMAARSVDLVVRNATLVTVDDRRRVMSDAMIAVDDGLIVAVGKTDELADRYSGLQEMDAQQGVVTPGYIDSHVHLSHQLHRSVLPDSWDEGREHEHWLPYWLNLTEEDAFHSALLACMEMALNGTTTFCDMSGRFSAEIQAKAAAAVGLRGIVSEICWDVPPHPQLGIGDSTECASRLADLCARFPFTPDAQIWAAVGLSGMGKASDDLLVAAKELADSFGVPMYMHQSFADADTAAFLERTAGVTAVEHLAHLGILTPNLVLVHMNRVAETEVEPLVESGASVVHCPAASTRWGIGSSRLGRVPDLLGLGVNFALGSDSGNYSDVLDMSHHAYLASVIHREERGGTPVITSEQAVEMATRNGARALGVSEFIGSIEVGKRADLVVHGIDRPEWTPALDPITSLIYAGRSRGVRHVLVDGRAVVRDGQLANLDQYSALAAIRDAARKLLDRMGFSLPTRWPVV
jgi:5-methylthioadenosine/S-adenosylhomocysteine deaminase